MKKLSLFALLLSLVATFAIARQEKVVQIFRNGKVIQEYSVSDIDYIEVNDRIVAPTNVKATVNGTQVTVTWDAVDGATYNIYRSPDDNNFNIIASKLTGNSFTDTKPLAGVNHYKVRAIVGEEESAYSLTAKAAMTSNGLGSGIYLGITGFNQALYEYPIMQVDEATVNGFRTFVDELTTKNGTLLYYGFDQALSTLKAAKLPSDVTTAAIITFTDGLDQGSLMMDGVPYDDAADYLEAMNGRIRTETVADLPVTAYTIGIRGNDVSDYSMFKDNLRKLASSDENAFEVKDMSEVNAKFQEIAKSLTESNYYQTLTLGIPGISNGTIVRFTFDNVSSGSNSRLYIEGRFNLKDRKLEDVEYHGMTCTSGTTIQGEVDGIFVNFTFDEVHAPDNHLIRKEYTDEWYWIESNSSWQINSEFDKDENADIVTTRSSAAIMLVLDCSKSLGSDFSKVQTNAKDFIETLYNAVNEGGLPEDPGYDPKPGDGETFNVNGVRFRMVKVDGGTYQMGSNNGDPDERPVHSETIYDFRIGETEVTQGLWKAVMGSNPSYFTGDDNLPVECVSWNDCQTFINKLNDLTGQQFRLPTEAEWEYAARGGNQSKGYTYSGSDNINEVAWYDGNSGNETHPVARKQPNELGIYDMSGNVWEWTSDWYSSNYSSSRNSSLRVDRGGGWCKTASYCRVAYRNGNHPGNRNNYPRLAPRSLRLHLIPSLECKLKLRDRKI